MLRSFRELTGRFVKNKWAWAAVVYWVVHSILYEVFVRVYGTFPPEKILLIHSPLDDRIPFLEWFVVPYVIWYLFVLAVAIRSFSMGNRALLRFHLLTVPCMLASMVFCLFVPNGLPLSIRPVFEELGRNNPAIWAVKLLYSIDSPPLVVMPSMHCSVATVLAGFYLISGEFRGRVKRKAAVGILSVLIVLSTVFIKQHSVLDLIFGVLLGAAVTLLVWLGETIYDRRKKAA